MLRTGFQAFLRIGVSCWQAHSVHGFARSLGKTYGRPVIATVLTLLLEREGVWAGGARGHTGIVVGRVLNTVQWCRGFRCYVPPLA